MLIYFNATKIKCLTQRQILEVLCDQRGLVCGDREVEITQETVSEESEATEMPTAQKLPVLSAEWKCLLIFFVTLWSQSSDQSNFHQ